jgi:hypothetical protein
MKGQSRTAYTRGDQPLELVNPTYFGTSSLEAAWVATTSGAILIAFETRTCASLPWAQSL